MDYYKIIKTTCIWLIFIINLNLLIKKNKKIKIGIFGCRHDINVGNFLIKYSMHIKLTELGYEPYIVTTNQKNVNISFLNRTTNLVIVKNYSVIKENDFDILLVNSDQTWRKWDKYFYDYGFLKFAESWSNIKFVFGASLGFDYWDFSLKEEKKIKNLIPKFTEISVREQGSIKLIEQHLGISPKLVLDPTLIIDKKYYLNLIKDFKSNLNSSIAYVFLYHPYEIKSKMRLLIRKTREILSYRIYDYKLDNRSSIEDFIYHIKNSKCVITNSFHGTIFSIIFEKPFVSFNYKTTGNERLKSFSELLGFENRIFNNNQSPRLDLLTTSIKINYIVLKRLRNESINYIIRNLKKFKQKN